MPSIKQPSISDVAAKAGVSVATVSRVMNNSPSVRPSARLAVEAAARSLGYALRAGGSDHRSRIMRVGLLIPDITNPYFPLLVKGVVNAARVQNCEILLYDSGGEAEVEGRHLRQLVDSGVDGIIFTPFLAHLNETAERLIAQRFPFVFLDREIDRPDICSVTSDNEEGSFQAITYLLHLGHREILYIAGPQHLSTTISRTAGYRRGLGAMDIGIREELVLEGDTTAETAYSLVTSKLKDPHDFKAIFASNDMMALGAWKAIQDLGFRVPDDYSIMGYDDLPFCEHIGLTTIAQPSFEVGRNAMQLLMELIQRRREPPERIVLRDSLIIRRSCRRL